MKLNCVIVDDEYLAIEVLKVYVSKIDFLSVQQTFKNPQEALVWLKANKTDILFIDVEMPKLTGFKVLDALDYKPVVILTTAYQHFAVKAFDLEIFDYLVKPIEFERFEKAVRRAAEYLFVYQETKNDKKEDYLIIKSDYKFNKIPFDDILYVEGLGEYVKIHTTAKTYITLAAIKHLEQNLPPKQFVRIHKSYIVSVDHILSYSRTEVRIKGSVILPVGRVYKQNLRKHSLGS